MIEKRVINGKAYWVDVIINPDGSRVETVFGNPMEDLANEQARAMEKVLEDHREKTQRDFELQQSILNKRKSEEEYALQKKKEELEREIAQLEKKKRKAQPDYNPDEEDVMFAEDNFSLCASKEEYECYWYIKNDLLQDVCTRSDLNKMLESANWKKVIWPKIKQENLIEAQKRKEKELEEKKKEEERRANIDKVNNRENKIKKLIFTLLSIILTTTVIFTSIFVNLSFGIAISVVEVVALALLYKAWW